MDQQTALRVFNDLEEIRYNLDGMTDAFPVFNVRLDAMTARESDKRSFRLFVRMDDSVPDDNKEDNLRAILDLAKEHGLTPLIENGGIELT